MSSLTDITSIIFKVGNTTQTPLIDLHSSGLSNTYDVRLIGSGGTSTSGQGTLTVLGSTMSVPSLTVNGTTTLTAGNVIFPGSGTSKFLSNEPNFCYSGLSANYTDPENGTARDAKFGQLGICVTGGVNTDTLNVRSTMNVTGASTLTTATATTPSQTDNSTNVATTAYVYALTQTGTTTVINTYTGTIPVTNGTGQITFSNSTPTTTGALLLWTKTITPVSSTSRFTIQFSCMMDSLVVGSGAILVFRGTTCIGGSAVTFTKTTTNPQSLSVTDSDSPATASAVTYSAYYGMINASASIYINRTASFTMNSALSTNYIIKEIAS